MIWVDGVVSADNSLSADRGYLVGDGVFETMLLVNGRVIFEQDHRARMRHGLSALGINSDTPDFQAIADQLGGAEYSRAAMRCTVTRQGGRGLAPPPNARARIVAAISAAPDETDQPLSIALVSRVRYSGASTNAFKCVGGYAENFLARMDALAVAADEALMPNERGEFVCASGANIYCIVNDRVVTPPICDGAMPGCARAQVARSCAGLGLPFIEAKMGEAELAQPLFLSNSLIGLRRAYRTGSPQPCAVFDRVKASYDEEVVRQGAIRP